MLQQDLRARRVNVLVLIIAITMAGSSSASAQVLTTLVNFDGTNGAHPNAGLIADFEGNFFGTTYSGGAPGFGTVVEIAKTSTGYATTPTTLVNFTGTDGKYPYAGLIADAQGNLFGTTVYGGAFDKGTVFEIVKTTTGYATTPTTLVNFDGANGKYPEGGLIADAQGNLFGTTEGGGAYDGGTVFEIAITSTAYATTPTTLVNFDGSNGKYPYAGLIADAQGNLFGTTASGGASSQGTVFEIAKTSTGYATTPATLVSFTGSNGAYPYAGLIGGAQGNLFGTTVYGGASDEGTVFEIAKTSSGYAGTPATLVSFTGSTGAYSWAGLIADAQGNLFGTTVYGGASGYGTVFEISASGFLPPQQFVGTPGTPNCHGTTNSYLESLTTMGWGNFDRNYGEFSSRS